MIKRRRFLLGALGATMALPFLETFAPKRAEAGEGDADTFAIFCRQANGVQQKTDDEPERFWPTFGTGPLTTAQLSGDTGRTLSELGDFADRLIAVRGLKFAFPGNGCGHSGGGNQCLTAAKVSDLPSGNESLAEGESIDNRIQRELGKEGVEPLTLYVGAKYGYLDEVLSYRGPQELRAAENNPYNVYQDLFGLSNVDPAALEILRKRRMSVNDLVRDQMQALLARKDLSTADRDRLDLHFTSIRDMEIGIVCGLSDGDVSNIQAVSQNATNDDYFEAVCKLQMDILALAVACGTVRAATLQFGSGNAGVQFTIDGVKQKSFHKISHRIDSDGSDGPPIPNADLLHHEIDRIHARLFRYLLQKLDAVKLADGSLLDAGVAVWLNDLGEKWHSYSNVPFILAGGCKGALKTGQYVDAGNVTHNRILSTIGAAVGCKNDGGAPLDDFGDPELSKGVVSQILA
ncbi:MAG: DUF1552 domain-containing protein [Polyangiaceae bacterium]